MISLKIYFVYFGMFFFGIAAAIYQIFCNPTIKKYADAEEYAEAIEPTITRDEVIRIGQYIKRTKHKLDENTVDQVDKILISENYLDAFSERNALFIIRMKYELINNSGKLIRVLAIVFYLIGAVFFIIPSLTSFSQVALSFYCRFFS